MSTERRGTKALELWCRKVTDGYQGVDVTNMTTSWRDGLAFCALIHRFRPDLIDFSSLRATDALYNNELAFSIAERHLGIPALLDAEDMVNSHSPDRLSVLTYLAQFYQTFGQASLAMGIISPGRNAKRQSEGTVPTSPTSQPSESPAKKISQGAVATTSIWRAARDLCSTCGLPVFLAERLACSGRIFHRTCFKCARCGAQLSPANFYETENHDFCCEVCPDEEHTTVSGSASTSENGDADSVSVGADSYDEYSSKFESLLEEPGNTPPLNNPALTAFLNEQLLNHQPENDVTTIDNTSPDLPTTTSPVINNTVKISFTTRNKENITKEIDSPNCSIDLNCDKNNTIENNDEMCSSSARKNSASSLVSNRKSLFENLITQNECNNVSRRSSASSNSSISNESKVNKYLCKEPSVPTLVLEKPLNESVNVKDVPKPDIGITAKPGDEVIVISPRTPIPAVRNLNEKLPKVTVSEPVYPHDLNPFGDDEKEPDEAPKIQESTNPFGSSDEEEVNKPVPVRRKLIPIDDHLNPFWEDGMEDEDIQVHVAPVPRLRSVSNSKTEKQPSPTPRQSTAVTMSPNKKKSAPPPPPNPSPQGSLRPPRKSRPAPRPPSVEALMKLGDKNIKDELNRTRQNLVVESEKSFEGKWKRKKGPAPPLPIPIKREIRSDVSSSEIRHQLELIEVQQRGLEKQGVRLEETIREQLTQTVCENDDSSLPPELEDNLLQFFELVNEKNELFRKQTEFMYLKRQNKLEEQQADLEWKIRCLLHKSKKTEDDFKQEEELIARLVEVVEQRNQIVDCLEMDRKREADEDKCVRERLQLLSSADRNQQNEGKSTEVTAPKKTKKKLRLLSKDKNKTKEKSTKKEDKKKKRDSLESNTSTETPENKADKKHKKKWF